jgi:hypothetical protein
MSDTSTTQRSDDGLWEWDGNWWAHIHEVVVQCPECTEVVQVRSDAKSFKCASRHEFDFIVCSTCTGATHRAPANRSYAARCPYCGASAAIPPTCRAWDWASNQAGRGAWPPGRVDTGRRTLTGLTLAAGSGTHLNVGGTYMVDFAESVVRIASESQSEEFSYGAVRAMEITDGPTRSGSERNRDIAGGALTFGVIGGLAAAGTSTSSSALLRIVTGVNGNCQGAIRMNARTALPRSPSTRE